jgi:hypothetical protein
MNSRIFGGVARFRFLSRFSWQKRRNMIGSRHPFGLIVALSVSLLAGCGGESAVTVQGKVTSQGKPVTAGTINFQKAGATLGGALNPDGSYSFELPAGEYRVRIDAPGVMAPWKEGEPEPKPVPRLAPAKYAGYETSGLTLSVTGGSDQQQDFDLP